MTPEERAAVDAMAPRNRRTEPDAAAEVSPDEAQAVQQMQRNGRGPAPARPAQEGAWGAVLRDAVISGGAGLLRMGVHAVTPALPAAEYGMRWAGGPNLSLDPVGYGERALEGAGLYRTPDATPTTPAQRYTSSAVQGAIGGAPFGPAGIFAGAVGGATGEGGAEIAREMGLNPTVQAGARLVGGIAGGMAGAGGWSVASRAVPGRPQPVLEARDRLGMPPRMLADVTPGATVAGATSAAARLPGAAGRIEGAANATLDDLSRVLDDTSQALTGGQHPLNMSPQQAGAVAQEGVRRWMDLSEVAQNWHWGRLWSAIQQNGVDTAMPNFRRNLSQVTSNLRREMPELADNLNDPLVSSMLLIMRNNQQNISVPALREIRSQIGRRLETSLVSSSDDMAALNRLYGSLTDDLRDAARRAGSADLFDTANAFTRDRHSLIDRVANNVLGRDPRNPLPPEQAYKWMTGNVTHGGTRVAEAARTLWPEETGAVGATLLRQNSAPGQPLPGANVSAANMNTFLNNQRNGISPEARNVLYGNARQQVDDLGTVAGSIRAADRYRNPSNTAGAERYMNMLSGTAGLAVGGGAHLAGVGPAGAAGSGVGTAIGAQIAQVAAANAAARGLTNQSLARYMARTPIMPITGAQGGVAGSLGQVAGFLSPMQRAMLGL